MNAAHLVLDLIKLTSSRFMTRHPFESFFPARVLRHHFILPNATAFSWGGDFTLEPEELFLPGTFPSYPFLTYSRACVDSDVFD